MQTALVRAFPDGVNSGATSRDEPRGVAGADGVPDRVQNATLGRPRC